jgi:hypothetical protein
MGFVFAAPSEFAYVALAIEGAPGEYVYRCPPANGVPLLLKN